MEKEEGISLTDLFKKIWRQKVLTVAVMLVVIIVGVIIALLMGKGTGSYHLTATYEFPGLKDSRYVDGTPFDYQDIVGITNLESVKASNEEFADIDVAKMVEKNHFSITASDNKDNPNKLTCSFSVKESYFKSKAEAKLFITSVVETPYNKTLMIANNFTAKYFLEQYDSSLEYDKVINLLENQEEYLVNIYEDAIESYGDLSITADSKLSTRLNNLKNQIASDDLEIIKGLQELNGYVNNSETISAKIVKIESLTSEKNKNLILINQYKEAMESLGSGTDTSDYTQKLIMDLITKNAEIDRELTNLSKIAENVSAPDSFKKLINDYVAKLTALTADCASGIKTVYVNSSNVSYKNASMVVYSSNTNKVLVLVASIFVGIFIGCVTGLIVDTVKNNNKKEENDEKEGQ